MSAILFTHKSRKPTAEPECEATHTTRLGEIARAEIADRLARLKDEGASPRCVADEVRRLAHFYNVSVSRIYALSRPVRAQRKPRTDKGRRSASLFEDPGLAYAAELVATKHLKPELALEQARLNGHEIQISVHTFQRWLREAGLDRRAARRNLTPYRRWEAKTPGEIFQIDASGAKDRSGTCAHVLDVRSRRLLMIEETKNHPNHNENLVQIWQITIVDDFSRRSFTKFYAVRALTSLEMIDFLLSAFRVMGVPKKLYSDRDGIIFSERTRAAAELLNQLFADSGGFTMERHRPRNAKATGKVENRHKVIEEFNRLAALKLETQRKPSLDDLNRFAAWFTDVKNETVHRTTGQTPMQRWHSVHHIMRIPPPQELDAIFKADRFQKRISPDMTIDHQGRWQLPRRRPFTSWATAETKIEIVWPQALEWFLLLAPDGEKYVIQKQAWEADAAGEFKTPEESTRQQSLKRIRTLAQERKRRLKETGEEIKVLGFDGDAGMRTQSPSIRRIPKPRRETDPNLLAALTHGASEVIYGGKRLTDEIEACLWLLDEGHVPSPIPAADKTWVRALMRGRDFITSQELLAKFHARTTPLVAIGGGKSG
jgi:hypothetical protein